jgi:cytochrome c biogenesis protein CcdA
MLRLLGLMISIGLADSINPTTIAPALYLASAGKRPRRQVTEFTASVFVVYLIGGALIVIGPGQIIRDAVSDVHVQRTIRHVGEIVAGVILVGAAAILWRRRARLVRRGLPQSDPEGRSSALLGAGITAVELPTAFPYFAAIAAILGSSLGALRQLMLLVVFNVCFVLPLIAILLTLMFAGDGAERILARGRGFLERRWPHVIAGLILVIGLLAIAAGVTGLAGQSPSKVGHFFRHIRKVLHLHP